MDSLDEKVTVTILLSGGARLSMRWELDVSTVVFEAVGQVKETLMQAGHHGPFLFFWNGRFAGGKISIGWKERVKTGDIFEAVPVVSGG